MDAKIKEIDVGRPVVEWLADMGWEIYQEVKALHADIVSIQNKHVWIIECKTTLNFKVIDQAIKQRGFGHWASVAVPENSTRNFRYLAKELCVFFGIGIITVCPGASFRFVREELKPKLNRRALTKYVFGALNERQKTYCEAGSPGGCAWSPFKATCEELLELIKNKPGIRLDAALKEIDHHYNSMASAKKSLSHWIKCGKVPKIESRKVGGRLCLFSVDE